MASWAILTALSGYRCDLVERTMTFQPRLDAREFRTFWSNGNAWGIYREKRDPEGRRDWEVEVLYGSLDGMRINGETALKGRAAP
jgi:non-lysosomal glucosylceramidase